MPGPLLRLCHCATHLAVFILFSCKIEGTSLRRPGVRNISGSSFRCISMKMGVSLGGTGGARLKGHASLKCLHKNALPGPVGCRSRTATTSCGRCWTASTRTSPGALLIAKGGGGSSPAAGGEPQPLFQPQDLHEVTSGGGHPWPVQQSF